ncbi:MAG: M20/M25/M40 family metallo-hydrolase [Bacteroidota bacterium]
MIIYLGCSVLLSCNAKTQSTQVKPKATGEPISIASKVNPLKVDSAQVMKDLKYLSSDELAGRKSGTFGNELAQKFIAKRFEALGLEQLGKDYFQLFSFELGGKTVNCKNIVGKIKGHQHPEKYMVLTAHFDHLGIRDEKIYNGADDNASGVAALLAAAAYFKKNRSKHSLIFVAFDAEELGLRGAKYFVDHPPVALDSIALNLNMDMISRNEKDEIYLCGTYHYPFLKKKLLNINDGSALNVEFGHDTPNFGFGNWTSSSDHAPFHKKKIPFIYVGVEDHEDYHKPTDTYERVDHSFFYHAVNLVIDIVLTLEREGNE